MAYETKNDTGSSFVNTRKEKDTHPDLTGKCMIGGKMYYISSWKQVGKDGGKWLKHAFKLVDEQPKQAKLAGRIMLEDDDIF